MQQAQISVWKAPLKTQKKPFSCEWLNTRTARLCSLQMLVIKKWVPSWAACLSRPWFEQVLGLDGLWSFFSTSTTLTFLESWYRKFQNNVTNKKGYLNIADHITWLEKLGIWNHAGLNMPTLINFYCHICNIEYMWQFVLSQGKIQCIE